jgi:hypothetical protein
LSRFISDSLCASPSSFLAFGLSMSPFQLSQFSVSENLSGELSSSISAGWRSIYLILRTFNIWVCPQGRYFADNNGGTGDFSHNIDADRPLTWKSDLDALMISARSEMYPTAVIWLLFSARFLLCSS